VSESGYFDSSKFEAVLAQYIAQTGKDVVEVLNQKAFFVARRALWNTKKADAQSIRDSLGVVMTARTTRTGRMAFSGYEELNTVARGILAARYRKTGGPWPKGEAEWVAAVRALVASRLRSVAFLKSGWIPAIRILETFAKNKSGAAPLDRSARIYGQEKGRASPAVEGSVSFATIENSAGTQMDQGANQALLKFGGAGLDQAFDQEAADTIEFIGKKLQERADKANREL
jgi:hypothetical protein